jgi:hypothetical protein
MRLPLLLIFMAACVPEPDPEIPRLLFALPIADPSVISEVIGVDHDPVVHDDEGTIGQAYCTNYAGDGFPTCYDEHDGTDLILEGGFRAMDGGSVGVVAAAAGLVVEVVDEHYDRCHADAGADGGVSCDGNPIVANKITIEHDDPITGDIVRTRYLHLMQDSALVELDDRVECGTPLGRVGSSGRSSMPHLHFELNGPGGTDDAIDPFGGPESQPESWWRVQIDRHGLPSTACE